MQRGSVYFLIRNIKTGRRTFIGHAGHIDKLCGRSRRREMAAFADGAVTTSIILGRYHTKRWPSATWRQNNSYKANKQNAWLFVCRCAEKCVMHKHADHWYSYFATLGSCLCQCIEHSQFVLYTAELTHMCRHPSSSSEMSFTICIDCYLSLSDKARLLYSLYRSCCSNVSGQHHFTLFRSSSSMCSNP